MGSVKTSYERDINVVIAMASMMLSIAGMVSFALGIIYIIRHSNFRFNLNN